MSSSLASWRRQMHIEGRPCSRMSEEARTRSYRPFPRQCVHRTYTTYGAACSEPHSSWAFRHEPSEPAREAAACEAAVPPAVLSATKSRAACRLNAPQGPAAAVARLARQVRAARRRQHITSVAGLELGGQAAAQPCSLSASAMSAAMTPILNEFMNTSSSVVRGACAAVAVPVSDSQSAVPLITNVTRSSFLHSSAAAVLSTFCHRGARMAMLACSARSCMTSHHSA